MIQPCSGADPLSKKTLLAIIYNAASDESQRVEIIADGRGNPDSGWFTLKAFGRTTAPIYYSLDDSANAANLNRALSAIVKTKITIFSHSQFVVTFSMATGYQPFPPMELVTNNLTYNGEPCGDVRVTILSDGYDQRSTYTLLRGLPLTNWDIISFNAATRVACIQIHTQSGRVKRIDGTLQKVPNQISVTLPQIN